MLVMSTDVTHLVPLDERPLHQRVAANVRAEMARYGVTQVRIANVLGVTQQTISAKKGGSTPFTLDELDLLAPLFGMTVNELIRGAKDPRQGGPASGAGWAPWGSNPRPAD
jgi:DNA-binding XRE family transcriptional regulator